MIAHRGFESLPLRQWTWLSIANASFTPPWVTRAEMRPPASQRLRNPTGRGRETPRVHPDAKDSGPGGGVLQPCPVTPLVRFVDVQKTFDGETLVVKNLNLDIADGEFLTLLGPSGSGKTTTLLMLAGFETVTHGDILLAGASLKSTPPYRRNIGMVFQNYALFPHMTVEEKSRLSAGEPPGRQGGDRAKGRQGAGDGAAHRLREASPRTALGRAAAARGGGAERWSTSRGWS